MLKALETGIGLATIAKAAEGALIVGTIIASNLMPDSFKLPVYSYSPEEIFKGNILLFDVNFFNTMTDEDIMVNYSIYEEPNHSTDANGNSYSADNPDSTIGKPDDENWKTQSEDITKKQYDMDVREGKEVYKVNYYYYIDKNGEKIKTSESYPARDLHNVIATWYVTIRNVCIVIMLSILVYIGIRMMLTSIANDKAKYKEMLKDWITGLCLLFIMHYIMAFSVTIVEKVTDIVKTNVNKNGIIVRLPEEYDGNLVEAVKGLEIDSNFYNDDVVNYPTNLMGKMRILLQLNDKAETGTYIGYVVCFVILVAFTVIFTFTYLKRLLYMAFLTLMAPMVAMTYCIDKVNDGQAQGFNTWLKEYIFNLLIQPMHLLLYYILITSAFELANTNIIYSIVVLGFMIPAEKLLRGMFGFEKAKTPPSLLGAATGASLFMGALRGLGNGGPHGDKNVERGIRTDNSNNQSGDYIDSKEDGMAKLALLGEKTESEEPRRNSLFEKYGRQPGESEEQFNARMQGEINQAFIESGLEDDQFDDFVRGYYPEFAQPKENSEQLPEHIRTTNINPIESDNTNNINIARVTSKDRLRDRAKRAGRVLAPKIAHSAIKGAKTYVRGSMAIGGAIAGGAITLAATGDVGKSLQGAAAGGTTGSALASRGIRTASAAVNLTNDVRKSVQEARDAWNGDDAEYRSKQKASKLRDFKRDSELKNALSKEFGEDKMKDMMETGGKVDTYYNYGARDAKDIVAMERTREKIAQENPQLNEKDTAEITGGIFQADRRFGNIKDRKKRQDAINHEVSNKVGEGQYADTISKLTMKHIDTLNEFRK